MIDVLTVGDVRLTGVILGLPVEPLALSLMAATFALGFSKPKSVYVAILQVLMSAQLATALTPVLSTYLARHLFGKDDMVDYTAAIDGLRTVVPVVLGGLVQAVYPAIFNFFRQDLPRLLARWLDRFL